MVSEDKRYKPSDDSVGFEPTPKSEKPHRICGECARFHKPECNHASSGQDAVLETDEACDEFQWAERPRILALGPYIIRVKRDLALLYEGDEPRYPIKIKELASTKARKSLAKDLGIDVELIHPVAAKLIEMTLAKPEQQEITEEKTPAEVEAEKKATEILESQDPIEFVADVIQKGHHGDREKSKILWLGTISPGLGYEINIVVVGTSGIGKSDLAYIVLCCVPDEYVVRLKECSPKAIYYAVKAGVNLDKAVVYFDDVPDYPETVKLLKDIASENRADPRLWSVGVDRDFLDVELRGDFTVFASAVENLTDPGDQIARRYLVINPDENPEENKKVLDKIKAGIRVGRGKRWLPPEFEVAKEVTRQIKEADFQVIIPFDFEYPDYGPLARSELKQFGALIWAVAKARFKQRLKVGKVLFAQLEDFVTAVSLWGLKQPGKVDETAIKILGELEDQEPLEEYDEKGRVIGWNPTPVTNTTIARKLRIKPKQVWEKLNHLYSMGYVDRKAIGGRGNPYAYWKSPAYFSVYQTEKSLSPIRLKDPVSEATDYFFQNRAQYSAQMEQFQMVVDEYLKRTKEYFSLLCLEREEIILKPESAFSSEKKPDDLSKLQTEKSLDSVSPPARNGKKTMEQPEQPEQPLAAIQHKNKEEETASSQVSPYGMCWLCRRLLPADLKNTTVLDGKHVHLECFLEWKKGQREPQP